jgi:hypothetical protein
VSDQSELTRTVYKAEVTAFLEWAGKPAQDAHIGDVVGYRQALADKGLAPATIAKKLSAPRSFYRVCHAQGLTPTNPTAGVKLPKVKEQGIDRSGCFLVASNQAGYILTEMLHLLFGLKNRIEVRQVVNNDTRKLDDGQSHHSPPGSLVHTFCYKSSPMSSHRKTRDIY